MYILFVLHLQHQFVSLFFINQEWISRHLSLGLLVLLVLFLILWPKSSDLLNRRGLAEC